ncbi:hypothetical protein DFH27DRAFT_20611 [Peziza echinospora]|nr:hypothetical protein DFH27DRAFT_20611 [Peziza echinospora]
MNSQYVRLRSMEAVSIYGSPRIVILLAPQFVLIPDNCTTRENTIAFQLLQLSRELKGGSVAGIIFQAVLNVLYLATPNPCALYCPFLSYEPVTTTSFLLWALADRNLCQSSRNVDPGHAYLDCTRAQANTIRYGLLVHPISYLVSQMIMGRGFVVKSGI